MVGFGEKNYISLREASERVPYSQDYLRLLIRLGYLRGIKFGRNWFTHKDWIDEYLEKYSRKVNGYKKEAVSTGPPLKTYRRYSPLFLSGRLGEILQNSFHAFTESLQNFFYAVLPYKYIVTRVFISLAVIWIMQVAVQSPKTFELAGYIFDNSRYPISNTIKFLVKLPENLEESIGNFLITAVLPSPKEFAALLIQNPPASPIDVTYAGFAELEKNLLQLSIESTGFLADGIAELNEQTFYMFIHDGPSRIALMPKKVIDMEQFLFDTLYYSVANSPAFIGKIADFIISAEAPLSPQQVARNIRNELRNIFTEVKTPPVKPVITALRGIFDRAFAFRLPSITNIFSLKKPEKKPIAEVPPPEILPKETPPEKVRAPVAAAPKETVQVREVVERKEIILPADVSSLQARIEALNSLILTNVSKIFTELTNLDSRVDARTSITTFAKSEKIDQLFGITIRDGLTIANGLLSSTNGFDFEGDGRVRGIINVSGVGTSTYSNNVLISGNLTVGGNCLNCAGVQSFAGWTDQGSSVVLTTTSDIVGIGTSTPGAKLSVSVATTAPAFLLTQMSTGDLLTLQDASTTVFTVKDGGSVGLGTTSPNQLLSVHGNGYFSGTGFFGGALTATSSAFLATAGGTVGIASTSPWGLFSVEATLDVNNRTPIFVVGDAGTTTPFLLVSGNNGNVGIGTTSPGALLAINGPFLAQGTSTINGGGLITGGIMATGTLGFYTAGTAAPRAVIDSAGNVGIGTTSPGAGLAVEHFTSSNPAFGAFSVSDEGTSTPSFIVLNQNGFVGVATRTPGATFSVNGVTNLNSTLELGGILKSASTATSSFGGGISISTAGGLSTVSGITVTGGSILATNIGATLGSTTVTGITSSNGIFSTAGDFLLTGGKIVSTGAGTSTFSGGVSTAGLSSSLGIVSTAGDLLLTGGKVVSTGAGTSTFSGGISSAGLASSVGLRVSAGDTILAGGLAVTGSSNFTGNVGIGTSSPWGLTAVEHGTSNNPSFGAFVVSDEGTSTPSLIVLNQNSFVGIATRTPGTPFAVSGEANITGTINTAGIVKSTNTATSSFSGGISTAGLASSQGLVISTGDAILSGGKLTVSGSGTSTYTGGISSAGLASSAGLTITGGSLLASGIGAVFGSTTATSPSFSSGAVVSSGDLLVSTGKIVSGGTGTSTYTGGISSAGLASSAGITVTGGSILATNIGATLGSTTVTGITSANGITLTGGCFKGPTGNCLGGGMAIGGGVTSGTSGSVLFVDASSNLQQDNTNFFWDDTNNRLGIGTSSPWGALAVEHPISSNPAYGAFVVSDEGTSTPSLIVLNQNSFVGIATRTPGTPFAVSGEANITGTINTAGIVKSTNTATSSFSGGISTAGLASSAGLTLTGGRLLGTDIGATLGSTTVTGITSSNGIFSTAGDFLLTGGKVVSTGTGTSTYSGGLSAAGLASSVGLRVSAGDTVLAGGLAVTGSSNFTGNVGIGTTSPSQELSIAGDLYLTGGINPVGGNVGIGTTSPWGLFSIEATDGVNKRVPIFVVGDAGTSTPFLYIDSRDGGVILGTTTPRSGDPPLYVVDDDSGTAATLALDSVAAGTRGSRLDFLKNNTALANIGISGSIEGNQNSDLGLFADSTSGGIQFYTGSSATSKMTITSAGNVGIGVTNPAQRLEVVKDDGLASGIHTIVHVCRSAAANCAGIGYRADGTTLTGSFFRSSDSTSIFFETSATSPAMTITNAGNVGIGTTSPSTGRFVVNESTGSTPVAYFANTSSAGFDSADLFTVRTFSGSFSGGSLFRIDRGLPAGPVTSIFYVKGDGTVGIGEAAPVSTLHVQGSLCVRSTGTCGTASGEIYTTGGNVVSIDVAENYPARDESLEAGDVVALSFQTLSYASPTASTSRETIGALVKAVQGDGRVLLGVISTKPGLLFGYDIKDVPVRPVALAGRVPIKVSLEGGQIAVGDRITSSSLPGVGMKATMSGQTVGIALEPFDGLTATTTASVNGQEVRTGKVLVFVNLGYAKLDEAITQGPSAWSVDQASGKVSVNFFGDMNLNGNSIINVSKIIGMWGKWSIDENGLVVAKKVKTDELEVGSLEKPTGITVYDKKGKVGCVTIEDVEAAQIHVTPGGCGTQSLPEPSPAPPPSSEPTPIPPPPAPPPASSTSSITATTSPTTTSETASTATITQTAVTPPPPAPLPPALAPPPTATSTTITLTATTEGTTTATSTTP